MTQQSQHKRAKPTTTVKANPTAADLKEETTAMLIEFEDHSEEYREAFLAYLRADNSRSRLTWRDWLAASACFAYVFLTALAALHFVS